MNRRVRNVLLIVLIVIVSVITLLLGGKFLYRHFVTDRITDWGGMENPDAQTYTVQED